MTLPSFKYGCMKVDFKPMALKTSDNLTWQNFKIDREDREKLLLQRAKCVFFTGLSGSGKSTIANGIEALFYEKDIHCYILDGDNVRMGINNNLGFSPEDRTENLRRIAEIAKLFIDAGIIVLCSFIAPSKEDREMIKNIIGENDFLEVYVKASVETCTDRDPKGLYKKAFAGEIKNFTGVSAPYDVPKWPSYIVDTESDDISTCVKELSEWLVLRIL